MALQAPIDRRTHDTLRGAVLGLREGQRRQRFAPTLHLGTDTGSVAFVDTPGRPLDAGARGDLVLAMMESALRIGPRPYAWLARPGELCVFEVDSSWARAIRWAGAAAGVDIPFVVVTKRGWLDPESGVRREWKRLRRHVVATRA